MLSLETKNILENFSLIETVLCLRNNIYQTERCKLKDYHLLCTV